MLITTSWKTWLCRTQVMEEQNRLQKKTNELKQLTITRDSIKYRGDDDINRGNSRKQTAYDEKLKYISKLQTSKNSMKEKRMRMFYFSKVNEIFTEWRNVTVRKKSAANLFSSVADKLSLRRALFEIKNTSNIKSLIDGRRTKLRRAIVKLYTSR